MSVSKQKIDDSEFHILKMKLSKNLAVNFAVVTGSMSPIIAIGDPIRIEPIRKGLSRFDIIVFKSGEILICHYVWHVNQLKSEGNKTIYTTRNLYGKIDLPITEDMILGVVVSHKIPSYTRIRINFANWVIKRLIKAY